MQEKEWQIVSRSRLTDYACWSEAYTREDAESWLLWNEKHFPELDHRIQPYQGWDSFTPPHLRIPEDSHRR